jgi:hypothetical protein
MSNNTQRYEVVADYPKCTVCKGQILHAETPEEKAWCDKYPHLFRPLKWWEGLAVDELPKYVKWVEGNDVEYFKVDEWLRFQTNDAFAEGGTLFMHDDYCTQFVYNYDGEIYPATEAEYKEYITKLNKK